MPKNPFDRFLKIAGGDEKLAQESALKFENFSGLVQTGKTAAERESSSLPATEGATEKRKADDPQA